MDRRPEAMTLARDELADLKTTGATEASLAGEPGIPAPTEGTSKDRAETASVAVTLPISTPRRRNRVNLDRGDGRRWTPPPTARELTEADPMTRGGGPKGCRSRRCWFTKRRFEKRRRRE